MNGSPKSVGIILKIEAIKQHNDYVHDVVLNINKRKMMSSIHSYLLDLIDHTTNGQATLFNDSEWETLKAKYKEKYSTKGISLKKELDKIWSILINICQHEHSKEVLRILDRHKFILNPNMPSKVTEYDCTSKIWVSLFDSNLLIDEFARIKIGKATMKYTTAEKRSIDDDENVRVVSFKVDIQFIMDHNDEQFTLGAVEVAKSNPIHLKIHTYSGKFIREGKVIWNHLLHQMVTDKAAYSMIGYILSRRYSLLANS
ncbi:unnamed protein product [Cunninghamella blakesleeana]